VPESNGYQRPDDRRTDDQHERGAGQSLTDPPRTQRRTHHSRSMKPTASNSSIMAFLRMSRSAALGGTWAAGARQAQ
jgi:hypothetical protein